MPFEKRDVLKIIEELGATSSSVRERIRARDLASSHGLEQMRRLWMLEEQKAWKREGGFDRIEAIAEMHAEA